MSYKRPSKTEYYLGIAKEVAKRGTCLRRNFGAVIVSNDQIISTGYAGSPRGTKNCVDVNRCLRQELDVPPGQRYELCKSVHAEMNAVIHASRAEMAGGSLFLVGIDPQTGAIVEGAEPCKLCKRVIINAGLRYVFVQNGENDILKIVVEGWIANEDKEFNDESKTY